MLTFPTNAPDASCLQHAANAVTAYCVRCGRAMCDLCTFWVGSAIFCPECLSSGPSADERRTVTVQGVFSILLALLGAVVIVGAIAVGASGGASNGVMILLGLLMYGTALGGIALGLVGREGAARTGSMLPVIGVVLNAVLLAIVALLTIVGVASGA